LKGLGCESVLVASSICHMRRALPLALIILGSQGISVQVLKCPNENGEKESLFRCLRDFFRAIIWLFTSWDGKSISEWVHPGRVQKSPRGKEELAAAWMRCRFEI
jgi:hypothetical protein